MGQVYILENDSMHGIIKIGYTNRTAIERADQLSCSTGVPTPFKVAHAWNCYDAYTVEKGLHEKFKRYRINSNREFFKAECLEEVVDFMNHKQCSEINRKRLRKRKNTKLKDLEVPDAGLLILSLFSRKIPLLGILLLPFWGYGTIKSLMEIRNDRYADNGKREKYTPSSGFLVSVGFLLFLLLLAILFDNL